MKHIVGLSGGKDSTAVALRLRELHPDIPFEYVCTPTGEESRRWYEHMERLEEKLGCEIVRLGDKTLAGLIDKWGALPNWRQRWCTRLLKLEPFYDFVFTNLPATCYIGLRADEQAREGYINSLVDESMGFYQQHPLQDWGWGLQEVLEYLQRQHDIVIDFRTDCMNCFFQTLWEWYELYTNDPEAFERYAQLERDTGHTFRSPQRDTWYTSLDGLAKEFKLGRIPRPYSKRNKTCAWCAA